MSQSQKKTLGMAIASLVFGLFFLIPFLGIFFSLTAIILGIIALIKISGKSQEFKGKGLAISGIVLGAVGIILIPIIGILAAIAIPNLLRARMAANEANAQVVLRTISTAAETHAVAEGEYPLSLYRLAAADRPYLAEDYGHGIHQGYKFNCDFKTHDYKCQAIPENCGTTGNTIYTITTGGELSERSCANIEM